MNNLEKRMYFLVPYNISPIQQAIQAGHAALEYALKYPDDEDFIDFVDNHKTWIILNGGTTNDKRELGTGIAKGTLNQALDAIAEQGNIKYSVFEEPDLNNALTAICLIVDERVFNREDYPDFSDYLRNLGFRKDSEIEDWKLKKLEEEYENLMGKDIVFLKNLLNTKKLA